MARHQFLCRDMAEVGTRVVLGHDMAEVGTRVVLGRDMDEVGTRVVLGHDRGSHCGVATRKLHGGLRSVVT